MIPIRTLLIFLALMLSNSSFAQTKGEDFTLTLTNVLMTEVSERAIIFEENSEYKWFIDWDKYEVISTRDTFNIIAGGNKENGSLELRVDGQLHAEQTVMFEGEFTMVFPAILDEVICILPIGKTISFQTFQAHRKMLITNKVVEPISLSDTKMYKRSFVGLVGAVLKNDTLNSEFEAPNDKIKIEIDYKNGLFRYYQKGEYPENTEYEIKEAYQYKGRIELLVNGKCEVNIIDDNKTTSPYSYIGPFNIWIFEEREFVQFVLPENVSIYLFSSNEHHRLISGVRVEQ